MSNPSDPLGLLGIEEARRTKTTNSGNLLLGILLGVVALFTYQRFAPDFDSIPWDREDQKDEQVQQDKDLLIFIHERKDAPIYQDLVLRELTPEYQKKLGVNGFRSLDDDLENSPVPELIQYAQTKGVSPPFVILTNTDDRPIKVASFPKDKQELEDFVK